MKTIMIHSPLLRCRNVGHSKNFVVKFLDQNIWIKNLNRYFHLKNKIFPRKGLVAPPPRLLEIFSNVLIPVLIKNLYPRMFFAYPVSNVYASCLYKQAQGKGSDMHCKLSPFHPNDSPHVCRCVKAKATNQKMSHGLGLAKLSSSSLSHTPTGSSLSRAEVVWMEGKGCVGVGC